MYWFILLFPLMIYPWGYDPNYTMPKVGYLNAFVLITWLFVILKRKYLTIEIKKSSFVVEYIILLFIFFVGISTFFSLDRKTSLYGFIHRYEGFLAYFSYCSVFLFSYRLIVGKKLEKLIPGMIVVSVVVSIYGILQHYLLDFLPRNSSNLQGLRSYAFFDNPNFFGSYLVLIILLGSTLILTTQIRRELLFYFASTALAFTALIFSETRSGWVGVFCGILFLSIFVVKRKDLWKRWGALLVTLVIIVTVINGIEKGNYTNRINSVVADSYKIASNQSTGNEGSNRFFIWKESLPLVKTYFWIGSGPDTFGYVFPANEDELEKYFGTANIIVDKAHNEYLQMAITLGIPVLLIYLLLIAFILMKAYKASKITQSADKIMIIGLVATILGYLIQAFFNISTVPVAPLFWAILGTTLAKSTLHIENANVQKSLQESTDKYKSA